MRRNIYGGGDKMVEGIVRQRHDAAHRRHCADATTCKPGAALSERISAGDGIELQDIIAIVRL